ncbi:MAG: exonuclease SbcC [Colwellia sp.]|jgi:exonuclease SbcC
MIFSKFFKAKWQSKEHNVRLTAISDELTHSNPDDVVILTNLAKTDPNELVRRGALIKMADFSIWHTNSTDNDNKKVREYCVKQVEKILLGQHEITISNEDKLVLLKSDSKLPALELWLQNETQADVVIALFEKINKPQLTLSIFTHKQDEAVQTYLLQQTLSIDVLEKLFKKSCNDKIKNQIELQIQTLKESAEKPDKIKKGVQLVLAKLLALKDINDYVQIKAKQASLEEQWNCYHQDFSFLTTLECENFNNKYQDIKTQLTRHFAPLHEAFEQQIIAEKLVQDKKVANEHFNNKLNEISKQLTTTIFESGELDEEQYKVHLETLITEIKSSTLNNKEQDHFITLVNVQSKKLAQLPEIAKSVSDATHLISKISQVALPKNIDELNLRKPLFDEWLQEWKSVEQTAAGILPESIVDAFKEIKKQWQQGLKPLIKEQDLLLSQCQKKISDVKRLVTSGKYNAAFGVFKKAKKNYDLLSDNQKSRVQRDFDEVSGQIAELSDLEQSIATPRKHNLLEEIQLLVNQPLDNPNDQAAKVKQFRLTWNSLGHAEESVEKDLNYKFNALCEQAFAPCRLFYAEQEKLRELHLETREQLINKAKSFADDFSLKISEGTDNKTIDWKYTDGTLNKLTQEWQNSGQVDKNKFQLLNEAFIKILQPVKAELRNYHQRNSDSKNLLIAQVTQALNDEDVFSAIESVKKLQTQWQAIGYSGQREENQLWQKFRKVNDQLFAKRDEAKLIDQSNRKNQQIELTEQLDSYQQQLAVQLSESELFTLQESIETSRTNIINQKPVSKSAVTQAETLLTQITKQLSQISENKKAKTWQLVFDCLEGLAANKSLSLENFSESLTDLPNAWQKRLQECHQNNNEIDRSNKTLELEILASKESPEEFKAERLQVQVQLMQSQMLSGQTIDLTNSLVEWLKLGKLSQADLPLLSRVKAIYC